MRVFALNALHPANLAMIFMIIHASLVWTLSWILESVWINALILKALTISDFVWRKRNAKMKQLLAAEYAQKQDFATNAYLILKVNQSVNIKRYYLQFSSSSL